MIDKLEFLIAIAHEKHFGRAAEVCGVTQPTLSAGLKQLEETLGVMLVRRGSRFLGFTNEGERFLEWARRIVSDARGLRQDVEALKRGLTGHLRIAAIPTALPIVAALTTPFQARHPEVRYVFLPGSTFLEKNGTFTNAERRIQRVRKVMAAKNGKEDWEVTMDLGAALGYPLHYDHPSEIMDEIARLTPTFSGVSYEKLEELGSIQWPCNTKAPEGTPVMHIGGFVRGKGRFMITEYVPTDEKTGPCFPLILTTGRTLTQYNVGAQTRRTANVAWQDEDVLEIHPHDAEQRASAAPTGSA